MLRGLGRAHRGLYLLATTALAAGCGDGPICPSEVIVIIASPGAGATLSTADDADPEKPGIQRDVVVQTTLDSGSAFQLTLTDGEGGVLRLDAAADRDGNVTFSGVTFPAGSLTLTVEATSRAGCGEGSASTTLTVLGESECSLALRQTPVDSDFYAPIPVLNTAVDTNGAMADFQGNVDVSSAAGSRVTLFLKDEATGEESELASAIAESGTASFDVTLPQGEQVLRATCTGAGAGEASASHTYFVDTVAPICELTAPAEGVIITPDFDSDGDDNNGIQFVWTATVDAGGPDDIEGEETTFSRGNLQIAGTPVDSEGVATTVGTAEFESPGTFPVGFTTRDHAANGCSAGFDVEVVFDGCSVLIEEPSATVTEDSDAIDGNGLQTDVVAAIGIDCAGQTATADCGQGPVDVVVPADGQTTFADVTLSSAVNSSGTTTCTVSVTNGSNVKTSGTNTVDWDSEAPVVQLQFIAPAGLTCGQQIEATVANDVDGDLNNGFQIDVRVVSPGSLSREVEISNGGSCAAAPCVTPEPPGSSDTRITLEAGSNNIVAVGRDAAGNAGRSADCSIVVANIALTFDTPVADGLLGSGDGTVMGGALALPICGTVSDPAATVVVSVDAGANLSTTGDGAGAFCTDAPVSLGEGMHVIDATASGNGSFGTLSQTVTVDLTPPPAPAGLLATAPTRADIELSWTAPDDGGAAPASYVVKYSTTPFTDFATQGTTVPGPMPGSPGTTETLRINSLFTGTEYYVGIAAADEAGNLSAAATTGPVIPLFDASGAIAPPNAGNGDEKGFGFQVAGGNYNGDAFSDIAVSAPYANVAGENGVGVVYIYFGSATGVDMATPDVTITGPLGVGFFAGPQFGLGLTRIQWDGIGGDDLAIGSPFVGGVGGSVYVFNDATLSSGTALTVADADTVIRPSPAGGGWFDVGGLGWSLSAGELNDGQTAEDLIIGAVNANSGAGGVVIVYGGSGAADIQLSSIVGNAVMNGAGAHYLTNPSVANNGTLFGVHVSYLGDAHPAGGVGDVGVGYAADSGGNTADERVYIVRGRTAVSRR